MKRTILIIDDETVILDSVSRILNRAGFETQTASTLHEANRKLRDGKFSLIISDAMIPHSGGLELINKLKKDPQYAGVPVILITAMDSGRLYSQEISADAVLLKPFDSNQLLETVQSQLGV